MEAKARNLMARLSRMQDPRQREGKRYHSSGRLRLIRDARRILSARPDLGLSYLFEPPTRHPADSPTRIPIVVPPYPSALPHTR